MPFKIKPSRLLSVPDTVDPNIVRVFDNFTWGDAGVDSIGPYFRVQEGSNAQTSISQGGEVNGEVVLLTGDGAAGTMAVNGVLIYGDRAFQASSNVNPLVYECRLFVDDITNVVLFAGFTDASTLEMPFTLGASDTLTSNATDAVGFLFDTNADTDNIWLVGVDSNVDATHQDTSQAYVASTYITLRLEVGSAGEANFFINGVSVGSEMTNAVASNIHLRPSVSAFSRNTTQKTIRVTHILAEGRVA